MREVKVRDGQRVTAVDPLIVLSDVSVDEDLNCLACRVNAERAGVVRLEAEQASLEAIALPAELLSGAVTDGRLAKQFGKERALFAVWPDLQVDALAGKPAINLSQRGTVILLARSGPSSMAATGRQRKYVAAPES